MAVLGASHIYKCQGHQIQKKYSHLQARTGLSRLAHMSSGPPELGLQAGNLRSWSKVNSILGRFWFVLPALPTSFLKKPLPPQPIFLSLSGQARKAQQMTGQIISRSKSSHVFCLQCGYSPHG